MKILQSDIETRDINLIIGEYGIALDDSQVYEIQSADESTVTLTVDELNDYPWAEHYDIESNDFMSGIVHGLGLLFIVENHLLKSFTDACKADAIEGGKEYPQEPDKTLEEYQSEYKSSKAMLSHSDNDNPLIVALRKAEPPSKKKVTEQKSRAKKYLTGAKYGKFLDRTAKMLVNQFQEKYGAKAFHLEPRQIAFFIFNGNSFDTK